MKKKRELTTRNGYFSKRVNNKTYYFGKDTGEASYKAALKKYKEKEPYLRLGISPEEAKISKGDQYSDLGYRYKDLLNTFLESQTKKLQKGEIQMVTLTSVTAVCDRLAKLIPKNKLLSNIGIQDFERIREELYNGLNGKPRSPKSTDRDLGYARSIFKFAYTHDLVEKPLRYEETLKGVPRLSIRKNRAKKFLEENPLFTPKEIRLLIKEADVQMRAMLYLSINGGYNRSDLGHLTLKHISSSQETLTYERAKTGINRVTPLWDETREALRAWQEIRPDVSHPFFFMRGRTNKPLFNEKQLCRVNAVFRKLLVDTGTYRKGLNLAGFRKTFATWGSELGDDKAVQSLMGHSEDTMLYEAYVQGVNIERLKRITDHIHDKLFNNDLNTD